MTATEKTVNDNKQENREINKKDLQLLLRGKLGKQVTVLQSTTSSLLPAGENFACAIFKIHAVIKRDDNAQEEELDIAAKLFPTSSIQEVFDFTKLFDKEIFFYEKLIPALEQLEDEFAAKTEESFGIGPRILGIRRSAVDLDSKVVDEGVVILMENLKSRNYYTLDKIEGADLNHSRMVIKALARFHALAIACKQHRPKFFEEEVIAHAKSVPFRQNDNQEDIGKVLLGMLCKDPRIAEHCGSLKKFFSQETMAAFFQYTAPEPWLSVAHLDLWTNNVLYHKDAQGNIDDVKFIDFQNYVYNSPLRDLPYYLCTSTSHEVMTNNFNELLDLYYETFIDVLKRMQCDFTPFTRESFDAQLKIDASFELFHNILAIKFFCAEIDKNTYKPDDLESVVIFSDVNAIGYDKWYHIICTFIKQGWL